MAKIAQKLLDFRRSLELSQTQIAERLEIPQRTWSSYETGRSSPTIDFIEKLTKIGFKFEFESTTQGFFENQSLPQKEFSLFKFSHGHVSPVVAEKTDINSLVLLPVFGQPASAGPGQGENQLSEIEAYLPIAYELLGEARPQDCGIVRIIGDSMVDILLFDGDMAIFDRTRLEGNGVYVISIGDEVRVKRLEYRPVEKKIIISSENARHYPTPEVLNYEQAESLLRVYGKVICWMHKHPY